MPSMNPTSPSVSASTARRVLSRYPVLTFFVLAYTFSWLITLPLLLGTNGLGLFTYTVPRGVAFGLIVSQSFGPMVAGLVMASLTGQGAWQLLKQYGRWRVGFSSYLIAFLGAPLMILLGATVVRGVSAWQALAPEGLLEGLMLIPVYLINLAVLFFIGGPLGEEAGWRGFALPRLQAHYGPLAASLILSLAWAVWHLPNFFIPEMGTWQGSLLLYAGVAVALSILHTWVYNRTQGSLLVVTLLHASVDASTRTLLPLIFGADRAAGNWVPVIGFGVWALLVVVLTRVQLGYQPETTLDP